MIAPWGTMGSSEEPACIKFNFVAEWMHFTLFGIILPTIKRKVYAF